MRLLIRSVAAAVVAAALILGGTALWATWTRTPLPLSDRCVATVGDASVTLDPERASYAALISGMSIRRGLPPRAASIALATAYQESGIRNLDYGHADSLGLFQQRPSKGWGTEEQVMDPWYASAAFYAALVRVKGWRTGDINDVAQAVQRSAYPEAYRQHVGNARTLASSLTGETPASFSCAVASVGAADPDGLRRFLSRTLGRTITVTERDSELVVRAQDESVTWAAAHLAIATTGRYGLTSVSVGNQTWTHRRLAPAEWVEADDGRDGRVVLRFG